MSKIIHKAVSVKNAFLMKDDKGYKLRHYDTIILDVNNDLSINHVYDCSVSSNRAINQAIDFLGISRDLINSKKVKYNKFVKYKMSNDLRKGDLITNNKEKKNINREPIYLNQCPNLILDPYHYNYRYNKCDCYNKNAVYMIEWGYTWNNKRRLWE